VVTKCGCGTAEQIKADIQNMINKGMTEKEIIDSYVAQYGQTVLAAPPRSGFNLTAWILPFAAFAFGGFLLFKFLRRNQQQVSAQESAPVVPPPAAPEDESYREQLRRDLEMRQ
jgi:cytochrome c-type biogenesis protein CcmH